MKFGFILWQIKVYQNITKLSCKPLALTSYKTFKKQKEALD